MRSYDEEIEVRTGLIGAKEGPAQFRWRRRSLRVSEVQHRWLETTDWWHGTQVSAARGDTEEVETEAGDLLGEEEVWRVVAGTAASADLGVYELVHNWSNGQWRLRAVVH